MSQNTTAMQRGAGGETTGATDMTTRQPEALIPDEKTVMAQAQVYASTWAIVGSRFDAGDGLELAEQEKTILADMVRRLGASITELESQLAQRFDAADMATAAAQGFRDGATAPAQPVAEPANSTAPLDERDAFEAWFVVKLLPMGHEHPFMQRNSRGEYNRGDTAARWEAWQARASHGQAPATQQPGDVVAYLDVGAGGYLDLGSELSEDALQQLPKGRHALVIAGTYGIDGYVAAPQPTPTAQAADSVLYDPKAVLDVFNSARAGSDKSSGYLRGILAVIAHWESRPEPHRWLVPAQADSVREDAARYRWLREQSSTLFVNISINGEGAEIAETLDSAVDAARKEGGAT